MRRNHSGAIILLVGVLLTSCARGQSTAGHLSEEEGGVPTQSVSPVASLAIYRNQEAEEQPLYQLTYDPVLWEEEEGEPFRKPLIHRQIPNCVIELDSNQTKRDTETTIQLGRRTWSLYEHPVVSPDIFHYSYYLKAGNASYAFDVFMLYVESGEVVQECRSAVEEVLASLHPQDQ